MSGHFTVIRH